LVAPNRSVAFVTIVVETVYVFAQPKEIIALATVEFITKLELDPLIIPFQVINPVPPNVIVLVVEFPKEVLFVNINVAVPDAGDVEEPRVKSPPIVMPPVYLPVRSLLAVPAIIPPLMVNVPPAPIALFPPTAIIPSFRVTPPANVPPANCKVPVPFLMNPVPAAVEIACVLKLKFLPLATKIGATVPPVPKLPLAVKVTFSFAVIEDTFVVAPVIVLLATLKTAAPPETQV